MRILYHHRTRATDAQRVHILEIVRAFRAAGHEVRIASLVDTEAAPAAPAETGEAGWKAWVRRVPLSAEIVQLGYNLVALPWLLWTILSWRPAFVYERHAIYNFAGVLAARLTGRPLILEVNSPLALEHAEDGTLTAPGFAGRCERLVFRLASKILVVSGPLKRILAAEGVSAGKIVVMPNGVDLAAFGEARDATALRERLGLAGATAIGFVGWFRPWHGLEMLVEAFAHADLQRKGAKLLLIGDGPATPALRKQAAALGLDDSVVFAGAVPHEAIPDYLALVDIAAQPAANDYCCPMKVIEYMAMAKPIVAPRQENITELLADDAEVVTFAPGDMAGLAAALDRLVGSRAERDRLGQAARAAIDARGLLWSENAARVVNLATQAGGLATSPL